MAAIVGSGINFVSARVGAFLNNMAERLQVETSATAGLITARAAGLQAAEWRRMAQIISQVSHDITRRIEEMGRRHF